MCARLTLEGSIRAALVSGWSLTGEAEVTKKVVFPTKNWHDSDYLSQPQITVTHLAEGSGKFFTGTADGRLLMHTNPLYLVNVWVPIPRGANGDAETVLIEQLRVEVNRVILAAKSSVADFRPLVPKDSGRPLHELDREPRILRYEITLIGAHDLEA